MKSQISNYKQLKIVVARYNINSVIKLSDFLKKIKKLNLHFDKDEIENLKSFDEDIKALVRKIITKGRS